MVWKQDMLLELDNLQVSLEITKSEIEVGVDNLEDGKKARDVKKKELLLHEMKQILAKLNEIDKKVVKDLKGDAFDFLRSVNKITDEIASMKDALKTAPENERNWKTEVNALKVKVENLECADFVSCLGLSVSVQPGTMAAAVERISDAIFLGNSVLNPKHFLVEMPEKQTLPALQITNPNYIEVRIHIVGEGAPTTFCSYLLQKLMVTLACQLPGEGIRVMEECSVWSKVEKKKAVVSEDGTHITVQLKRPNNTIGKISVQLLGTNIVNSPMLHQFGHDENKDPTAHNLTLGNDSIGIFDTTGLDQSDVNSLDMTARRQMFLAAGKKHLLSNPTLQPSPAYNPIRGMSRQSDFAPVPDKRQLNSSLPFSPCSEGAVSTMRATAAASKLAGALHKLASNGMEGSRHRQENGKMEEMDESNLSILAPSRSSALSIDEMQRSLSGSESGGGGDKSMVFLDKSVSFAPQTQVVEVLSTPQVAAGSGNTRFLVAQGQTKDRDGQAGLARRLHKEEKNGGSEGIWDVSELDAEDVAEEYNPASAVTLPLVAGNDFDCPLPRSCISPLVDSYYEDPHLMLNASKAPSPQSSWSKEDSIWDIAVQDSEDDDEDYYNHPHLMLNASKAPPIGADWPSVDPSWDGNSSLLPQCCSNQSPFPTQDNNQTIWETDSELLPSVGKFDILLGCLEVADVYESHPITSSSTRGTKHCLLSPHSITFLPQRHCFLVTEPDHNRVGQYEAESFKFIGWLGYPEQFTKTRQNYTFPTSILCLANGYLVLIERNRLHVFDGNVCSIQSIGGVFHGLTEGPEGEIYTLSKNKDGNTFLKKLVRTQNHYKWMGQISISTETLSKARFLLYSNEKIFITDQGFHKLFIVDLRTGEQTVTGYMGSNPGQLKRPTGLLADDMGNLLVGDSGNNRLSVYTDEGKFVKVVGQVDWRFSSSPHGLVRHNNSVLAVFRGGKEGAPGGIVRYRLHGDSGPNTPEADE